MVTEDLVQQVSERLYSDALRRVVAKLRVEELGPLTVGIDARGTAIYQQLESAAHARLPQILSVLAERRNAAAKAQD